MSATLHTIYESNHRDPVASLRRIADEIESGKWGEVGSLGVVLLGDTMQVFGAGADCEAPAVGMLLHAGFMRMSQFIEQHGQ